MSLKMKLNVIMMLALASGIASASGNDPFKEASKEATKAPFKAVLFHYDVNTKAREFFDASSITLDQLNTMKSDAQEAKSFTSNAIESLNMTKLGDAAMPAKKDMDKSTSAGWYSYYGSGWGMYYQLDTYFTPTWVYDGYSYEPGYSESYAYTPVYYPTYYQYNYYVPDVTYYTYPVQYMVYTDSSYYAYYYQPTYYYNSYSGCN